jgi:iron complex outermembrane receptor protein
VSKRYGSDNNSDTARGVAGVYDPYLTVDGKVKYAFTPRLSLSLAVNNIFNEEYFSNARAPGRSFFGELTMKF